MDVLQTSSIESCVDKILPRSKVVFDWDNTLKVTSADRKHIESGLCTASLNTLVQDKQCTLYIISAIRPTRINLDTLLLEVDKLGLRRYFCPKCQSEHFCKLVCSHDIKPDIVREHYAYNCWGNIVICGYDKAEVFLELLEKDGDVNKQPEGTKTNMCDEADGMANSRWNIEKKCCEPVYFFDDEDVNIENFSRLVKNSACVLVKR